MRATTQRKTKVSRRGFLGTVFSASAFVLAARVLPSGLTEVALASEMNGAAWHLPIYMGLEADGTVIVIAHRSEMGTGIRTSLPMVAADELGADWKRVRIEQAIGDKKYGDQNTDGSKSIKDFWVPMRAEAATARMMLESAAASKWGVPAAECSATNHEVVHAGSGRKIGFGELVTLASQQPMPKKDDLKFKPASEYRYIGKGVPIADMGDIVTGKGTFGMDAHVPGMVYASIERCPVIGGTLKSCDDSEALKVKGVSQTVKMNGFKPPYMFQPLGGVAVIADNTWAAFQGRQKLKIEWTPGDYASYESESYRKSMQETARAAGRAARSEGNVEAVFAAAPKEKVHEAEYTAPLLSHAPMEPPVAVAEFRDGKVTAWAPTQNPQAVQQQVAASLGITPADVTCNVTLLGGGFGRKSKPDYVAEAAVLAKQLGKPVKVVWSREDDIHFDYFHSPSAMYMKAATDDKGRPTAWLQRSVFPPILSQGDPKAFGTGQLSMGWLDVPFEISNLQVENGPAAAYVRIGWLRSVSNIYHAFAVQSFADELAAKAGRDRVEYLLDLIGSDRIVETKPAQPKPFPLETARLKRVLHEVAEQSGWAKHKSSKGHGWGVAVHRSFLTYVATVVEVVVDDNGKVRIPRVDTVVDAGLVVHPERAKSQFEGAAVFGAGIALMSEITADKGRIKQSNFHDYRVARINEAPVEVHVTILPSTAPPAGIGEPGVPPIAPAITNAIFAATGKRIRELPVKGQLA